MTGDDYVWWAAYHTRALHRAHDGLIRVAGLGQRRIAARYAEMLALSAVDALTYTLLALGYGPCPDCDGGGTPIEAPCERCCPEERRAWEVRDA